MRLCKQPEEIWLAVDIGNVNIIGPEIATFGGYEKSMTHSIALEHELESSNYDYLFIAKYVLHIYIYERNC